MASPPTNLFLHNHPVSSYAQKVRIALREKNLPFTAETPVALGSGNFDPSLQAANPRLEVPALIDSGAKIFDSTIIVQYLEDRYPEPALLPSEPAERARGRMVEEVCDTTYEAINWVWGEVTVFGRAEGEKAEKLFEQMAKQTKVIQAWLAEQLGDRPFFNGASFGHGDLSVAPVYNRSVVAGMGAPSGSPLDLWHQRIQERESVKQTFAEFEAGLQGFRAMKDAFMGTGARREYRDHRLEFMIKSGALEIVEQGIREKNVRFGWPEVE